MKKRKVCLVEIIQRLWLAIQKASTLEEAKELFEKAVLDIICPLNGDERVEVETVFEVVSSE